MTKGWDVGAVRRLQGIGRGKRGGDGAVSARVACVLGRATSMIVALSGPHATGLRAETQGVSSCAAEVSLPAGQDSVPVRRTRQPANGPGSRLNERPFLAAKAPQVRLSQPCRFQAQPIGWRRCS